MDQRFVAAGTIAALVTLVTILTLRRLAPRIGLVDRPDERKRHRGRVPLVGGASFLLGTIVGLAYYGHIDGFSTCLLATGALVFLAGLIDDMQEMGVTTRLLVQSGVAVVVIAATGIYVDGLGDLLGGEFRLHVLGIPLTIIAVVGLINAVNMLDGIDGLAAGMALVSIFFILVFASAGWPTPGVVLVLQVLSLTLVPYLFANLGWPDGRKIFMGDAGSTSIGFLLAWSLIYLSHREVGQIRPVDVPWCIAIPVMDTAAVMARRISKGCSPFKSDRRHLHHRLLEAGFSARETLMLIVSAGIAMGSAGYALRHVPDAVSLLAFLLLLAGYVWKQPHLVEMLRSRHSAAAAAKRPAPRQVAVAGRDTARLRAIAAADLLLAGETAPAQRWPEPPMGEGGVAVAASAATAAAAATASACVQPSGATVKALCVMGASADDVALAPIVRQLCMDGRFESRICVATRAQGTAQVLRMFGIRPDLDLDFEDPADDGSDAASVALGRMKQVLSDFRPDIVLVQGDAPAALAVAMAARYEKVPVAHLDTWLPYENHAPWWSDQANHRLIGTLASLHLAPTRMAGRMLVSAGVPEERVAVVDSAAAATLRSTVEVLRQNEDVRRELARRFSFLRQGSPLLLVVNQSREETYPVVVRRALRTLAARTPELDIVCPAGAFVPGVQAMPAWRAPAGIHALEALDYLAFAYLLGAASVVLTNSGEVRAEAAVLGKPAVLVRDSPRRATDTEPARWIAGNEAEIIECVTALLADRQAGGPEEGASEEAHDGREAYVRIVEELANLPQRAGSLAA
ncbi:MAG TPA: UDP-N-acetylglucosamine 2-epimerase [Luteimonas sp.]|nr:UDP-N-acetylglucosamine 2-epimerase [Luteimonas sp.]